LKVSVLLMFKRLDNSVIRDLDINNSPYLKSFHQKATAIKMNRI